MIEGFYASRRCRERHRRTESRRGEGPGYVAGKSEIRDTRRYTRKTNCYAKGGRSTTPAVTVEISVDLSKHPAAATICLRTNVHQPATASPTPPAKKASLLMSRRVCVVVRYLQPVASALIALLRIFDWFPHLHAYGDNSHALPVGGHEQVRREVLDKVAGKGDHTRNVTTQHRT